MKINMLAGSARPESVRERLVALKGGIVEVCATGSVEAAANEEGTEQAREAMYRAEHPTRRDERPPSIRSAEEALMRDLGMDGEGLGIFE